MSVREHIRLLGILNVVWGSVTLAAGIIVLLVFGGLAGFLSIVNGGSDNGPNNFLAGSIMALIGLAVVIGLACLAAPTLIGGIGLLKMKSWSRLLVIILSILHLISFPIGTALGFYGVWVLFKDEARLLLQSGGVAASGTPAGPV